MAEPTILAQLDATLRRLVTLCEDISVNWSAFLDHAKTADRLAQAVRAEAAADRIKASDIIRMEDNVKAAKVAMDSMMQSIKQASVGSLL